VVASPRIADYRIERLVVLSQIVQGEIAATAYIQADTSKPDERKTLLISRMEDNGIKVAGKADTHHCLAIIDQSIIWYGSINLLGHATKRDATIRIVDTDTAKRLLVEVNSEFR
jgi:hypothetical protein